MIRTSIRLGIAAAASLAVTLGPAAIAQAKAPHCHRPGTQTLATDSYARVYGLNGHAYVCIKSSGKTTLLQGASPATNKFALGGKWVGWSSDPVVDPTDPQPGLPNSVVTVMRIPDHFVSDQWYPLQTNENVDKLVVASDGAAAWAISPPPGDDSSYTIVQGTDRQGHPADQFSDDHADLIGSSLKISGKTVSWQYTDGTSGSQALF